MLEISVIIPTYKPGDYFRDCLESLRNQTLSKDKFEVIIVLNGCSEPWHSGIKDYIERYAKDIAFRLIQTDTPGVSNARNIGIDNAKGEYITFIDDDDYVSKEFLKGLLQVADTESVVLTDSRAFIEGKDGFKADYTPHITYDRCHKQCDQNLLHARAIFNGPCMKLFPKSFIQGNRFDPSISNGEDALFIFLISKNIKNIKYAAPDAIYFRRYRENSASTRKVSRGYWIANAFKLNFRYLSYWVKNPFAYNLIFMLSRIAGNLKSMVWHLKINGRIDNLR